MCVHACGVYACVYAGSCIRTCVWRLKGIYGVLLSCFPSFLFFFAKTLKSYYLELGVCVCECASMCACTRACMWHVCTHMCMRACVCCVCAHMCAGVRACVCGVCAHACVCEAVSMSRGTHEDLRTSFQESVLSSLLVFEAHSLPLLPGGGVLGLRSQS